LILLLSFRRQHDQLRLLINRVLRPALSQELNDDTNSQNTNSLTNGQRNNQVEISTGLDVADANAIEVS
jgi:hypothetical protein